MQSQSNEARFWAKVDRSGACWLYLGGRHHLGYGVVLWEGRQQAAHRVAYALTAGPIPPGLVVWHRCNTQVCVRPEHLYVTTRASNARGRAQYDAAEPAGLRITAPISLRFWSKVQKTNRCWRWTGALANSGYGKIGEGRRRGGRTLSAHRVSYELHFGPIPDGLYVLHSCDTPSCVRPDHLRLGTQVENMQDMLAKGRQRKARH